MYESEYQSYTIVLIRPIVHIFSNLKRYVCHYKSYINIDIAIEWMSGLMCGII